MAQADVESQPPGRLAAPATAKPVLEAVQLRKRYGRREVLRGVSLAAPAGALVAVTGPNGAGKTTLLGILGGTVSPDGGELRGTARRVGWVPQQPALYRRLTVAENLRLFARLERVSDPEAAVERMLEQTELTARRDDQVGTLSGGNQQRVNIALGLLSEPDALLLDEPTAALDPRQRERLWSFVAALGSRGTTVVFTTHNVHEAERHGDQLLVLADGEALLSGSPAELRAALHREGEADPAADADFESAFVAFLRHRGH